MMGTVRKAVKRLWRICTLRKGVYAKIGKGNKFGGSVFIHEMSQIGSHNYIGRGTMMTNAQIGSYCSIAPGVKIGQAEHSAKYITTYNRISEANIGFDMFKKKSVIGSDVWIGANAIIMQGVKIGTGAIIGGGSGRCAGCTRLCGSGRCAG